MIELVDSTITYRGRKAATSRSSSWSSQDSVLSIVRNAK